MPNVPLDATQMPSATSSKELSETAMSQALCLQPLRLPEGLAEGLCVLALD